MAELEEQIAQRRRKRDALREAGVEAFPARAAHDAEPFDVVREHGARSAEELAAEKLRLRVPGRVRAKREQGKLVFLDLHDGREKLQLFVRRNLLDEASAALLDQLDLGDYLLAEGELLRTRTGELSIAPERLTLLSKALRPLPEKWHGLADTEIRYRQRYLDLIANPESRRVFEIRAAIIRGLRAWLDGHGFLEVETPMMQPIPGGAAARPFVTHHNALDIELYLRIAPELYLKRLLVGGLHRVYEINRNFRNEGISTQHNPEFTMLEFYWAYTHYEHLMDVTEEMIRGLASSILGEEKLAFRGRTIDLARPWKRLTMAQALEELADVPAARTESAEGLLREYRDRRRRDRALTGLRDSLLAFFEGRYGRAERLARGALSDHALAGSAALIGARSAQRMHESERRDSWLESARLVRDVDGAYRATLAEIALEEHRPADSQ